MVSEWSGGHGEYRRGPAPPHWPAGGQKGVGPGDQQPQTADGGRGSSCCQNQGEDGTFLLVSTPEWKKYSTRLEGNCFKRTDCVVDGVFVQRRTLIISELENQGTLETPLNKQVENLETEIGLRWDRTALPPSLERKRSNSSVIQSWWLNGLFQERADRWPSTESPCRRRWGSSQTAHWWNYKYCGGKVRP